MFLSLLLALPGCAKLDLGESFTLWKSEPKPQTPDSLAAVWTETTLHQPGKPVVRGFGGRILFHGSDQQQAVPVEGKVIVYAYDDDRPNQEDPAPDKKYVFPATIWPLIRASRASVLPIASGCPGTTPAASNVGSVC